ncbi:MAG: methylated-DNA--[protein]-cysteine S-methyltransferase [Alphaproteobacteria bacterium]|nr:methylated-DNA--[protein]-cysteine S-methyltransferase [Alphaproteobacteria bacterium]
MTTRMIDAPVGRIELEAESGALVRLTMLPTKDSSARRRDNAPVSRDDTRVLDAAERQLAEYFAGRRTSFDLPLSPEGTAFRQQVWRALCDIPYGETRTYGDLARKLKTAARAVGGACGANPIAIVVPCHRVVGGGGAIGGFSGGDGCDTKRVLLALEERDTLFAKKQRHG